MDKVISEFTPGTYVMQVHDPLHIGIVCDQKPMERGDEIMVLVNFDSGQRLMPLSQLKIVNEDEIRSNPMSLLQNGRLGNHKDFRRALVYTRFSGRLADVMYSMEATNTDFHAYQFKPVIKMLEAPSNSLLIADEVGLGKTIEAGLIWTELRSRYNLNKLWVICPSSLCEKWEYELSDKMGISAEICDATKALKNLNDAGKREKGFAIITSMQGLRPPKNWYEEDDDPKAYESERAKLARFLHEKSAEPNIIDMLIVDEAHHMRNSSTQTNKIGGLLRDISEYLVFLSATPIHNRNADLLALLKLLDSETFDAKDALDRILEANEPLVNAIDMVNRSNTNAGELKAKLESAQKHDLLRNNQQLKQLLPRITDVNLKNISKKIDIAYCLEKANLLSHAITRTRKREVQAWRVTRSPDNGATKMTGIEKKFYEAITQAIRNYAATADIHEGFVLAMPQRQMTSSMAAAYRTWNERIFDDEEKGLDDDIESKRNEKEAGDLIKSIVGEVKNSDITFYELKTNDSKFQKLRDKLNEYRKEYPNKKIIIFSAFRGTLAYLKERFDEENIESITLQGGGNIPKEKIIEDFKNSDSIKILLSSEVGGEGVDLQFCDIVVNYDLPWNPMRLEQRIGRVDRLGQKSDKITILNLLNEDTIDFKIYKLLYEKLERIHQTFGEFEAILGSGVKKITDIYLTEKLSDSEREEKFKQTEQAVEKNKRLEKELEDEAFHLIAHGDYILNQVNAAKEMKRWISNHDLYRYAYDFLLANYPGCDFVPKDESKYEFKVSLSRDAQFDLLKFIKNRKLIGQTQLADVSPRICQFENRSFGKYAGNKEFISQFHPLIRFITEKISESKRQIHPAVVLKLPRQALLEEKMKLSKGVYVLVASLWSVRGLRHIEKLNYAIANLDSPRKRFDSMDAEKLARIAIYEGKLWVDASKHYAKEEVLKVANEKLGELDADYKNFFAIEKARNEDRAEIQERNLDAKIKRQIEILKNTMETNKKKGQTSSVRLNEARLDKLMKNHEQQKRLIRERRTMKEEPTTDICIAIISVE